MTKPPTDKDREHAALILDQIERLREIGELVQQDTRENEILLIAYHLRNVRMGLTIE